MRMTGNTMLITGGTSGIGRALAEAFHDRGNQVIIAGRRERLLDEIVSKRPGMHGMAFDLDEAGAIDALAEQVADAFPSLNVLVNNAGISREEKLTAQPFDVAIGRSMIETNIAAVLHLTGALLPVLQRQSASTIMATSSGLAFVPRNNFATYCATKAFLHSWLQSLRVQLAHTSIEVLELVPPYVQTELGGSEQMSNPHAMPLAEFTSEVMQLLDRGDTPDGEILVERVKKLRLAERDGQYKSVYAMLNTSTRN